MSKWKWSIAVLIGILILIIIGVGLLSPEGLHEGGLPISLGIYQNITMENGDYQITGEISHSGYTDDAVVQNVEVHILGENGDVLRVVEIGNINLSTVRETKYTFNTTTNREPQKIILKVENVIGLGDEYYIELEGKRKVDGGWTIFHQSTINNNNISKAPRVISVVFSNAIEITADTAKSYSPVRMSII